MTTLTISRILAIPLTARMAAGTRTAQGVYDHVSIVLVEVRTTDGITGYGECLGRFGARAYAGFINEVLAPKLVGGSAFDIKDATVCTDSAFGSGMSIRIAFKAGDKARGPGTRGIGLLGIFR